MDPCPPSPTPPYRRLPAWLCLPLLFALTLALDLAFAQHTFYKADGQQLVLRLMTRDPVFPTHVLLMPTLIGLRDLWQWLALPPVTEYQHACLLSALSGALAATLLYATARRLNLPGALAWFGALTAAAAPAPLFFATVVEFHAFHHAFAALALLCATRLGQRPGVVSAVLLAVAMLLGYLSHASGALLPTLCVPWALLLGGLPVAPRLCSAALAVALFAALVALSGMLAAHLGFATPGNAVGFVTAFTQGEPHSRWLTAVPVVAWREFLVPYFPLWLLAPLPFFLADCLARRLFVAATPALLAYLGMATVIIPTDPEWGAYLIPLAGPLAMASMAACAVLSGGRLGHFLAVVLLAVALTAGIATVRAHDKPHQHDQWLAALRGVVQDQPAFVWLGSKDELDAVLLAGAPVPFGNTDLILRLDAAAAAGELTADTLRRLGRGQRVIVTRGALDLLRSCPQLPQARAALQVLENWPAEPLESRGLDAFLLRQP